MKKTVLIEGMMCEHCKARVERALSAVAGVKQVMVDLKGKTATVSSDEDVENEKLSSAVTNAGYTVIDIK